MSATGTLAENVQRAFEHASRRSSPYVHWVLTDIFSDDVCEAICGLPFPPPDIDDTKGRRETHNSTRVFFSGENRRRFDVCEKVAAAFQDADTTRRIEETVGTPLRGGLLRIEFCQDTEGFWLEPHTDIGAKLLTLQIYLSKGPGAEAWGTDVVDGDMNIAFTVPARFNSAFAFVPGADTWHSFRKRPIQGVRRSMIVNYVKDEWRSRHELAFPDTPVA